MDAVKVLTGDHLEAAAGQGEKVARLLHERISQVVGSLAHRRLQEAAAVGGSSVLALSYGLQEVSAEPQAEAARRLCVKAFAKPMLRSTGRFGDSTPRS